MLFMVSGHFISDATTARKTQSPKLPCTTCLNAKLLEIDGANEKISVDFIHVMSVLSKSTGKEIMLLSPKSDVITMCNLIPINDLNLKRKNNKVKAKLTVPGFNNESAA